MAHATQDARDGHGDDAKSGVNWSGYGRLLAMVLTSTVAMYGFMYWNTYRLDDIWLSETRAYMSVTMFGLMLPIMLGYMLHMYRSRAVNAALFAASGVIMALGIFLVRSQVTVQDVSWMKSMIPHHSIAVMVSERAEITDPRARKLADEIIAAQEKEMAEMEYLIRAIREEGEAGADYPTGEAERPTPVAASLAEALMRPALSTVDPGTMSPEEVARVVPDAACAFRFAETQQAIVALGADGTGVMKVTGQLLPLTLVEGDAAAPVLATEGLRLTVTPRGGTEADLVMEMQTEPAMRVGYSGHYACP
jgi:hypothetical protein